METGYVNGGAITAPASPRAKPDDPRLDHEKLAKQFNGWDQRIDGHWSQWNTDSKEAYEIVAGRQWDKDAEQAAEAAKLTTISINRIDSIVSAVCGSEMTNRQEVRYFPREMSTKGPDGKAQDAAVNEIFTAAAEWIRDECDASDEESEAFRDCVICGIGVTETRMDYEEDPEGVALIMRVSPFEIRIDPSSRRPGAVDAQYIRRKKPFTPEEAKLRFGIEGESGRGGSGRSGGSPHHNYPGSAYQNPESEVETGDQVWVTEYQWWELEKVWRVLNPRTGQIEEIPEDQYQRLIGAMPQLESMSFSVKVRRYYRAFRVGDRVIEATSLPDDEFTYKFVTGKLDQNRGVWYGIVRAMIEPQKLLNKQISQTQRIIDNNAKGGLLAEIDAFDDPEQAKQDWAASDTIVWASSGAIAGNRIIPKPIAPTPAGVDKLLAIAQEAVQGVSGVNNEMLGIIDREQAGVVDVQRKEAAYGVLKGFFNSLRRYRKVHGRHLLKLIQKYMTDGRLVRIIGRNGNIQYLPLIRDPNTARFDTIVDEAPTGPNQKDKVFQFLMMFGAPVLSKLNLPPQVWLKFLEFSPLPTALVSEIQQMVSQMPPQADPKAQQAQAEQQMEQMRFQMDQQKAQAEMQAKQAAMQIDMQMQQAAMQMKAQTDRAAAEEKLRLQSQEMQMQGEIRRMEAEREAAMEAQRMQMTMTLERWKADQEARLAQMQFDFEAKMQERELAFNQKLAERETEAAIKNDEKVAATKAKGASTQFGGDPG
jgi:hypothetical protein